MCAVVLDQQVDNVIARKNVRSWTCHVVDDVACPREEKPTQTRVDSTAL
jgi:hypothetical protein